MLPAFTYERAIGNLWKICLGVNIFNPLSFIAFIGNIPLLKALRVNSWPSVKGLILSKVFLFFFIFYFLV